MIIALTLASSVMTDMHTEVNSALGGSAVLQFWDGTMPATCEDVDTGTMLVQMDCANPAWDVLTGDTFPVGTIADGTAINDGTATYVRMKVSGGGACILQWEVDADFTISGQPITTGDNMHIDSMSITLVVEGG